MTKLAKILFLGIIVLTFSFCNATKNNIKNLKQDNHPFKVTNSTYTTWTDSEANVKGIRFTLTIDNPTIKLDTVFFRNMTAELKRDLNAKTTVFVGNFMLPTTKKDYQLNIDPKKEYGNSPPNITLNIPFELKVNEAIVSYIIEDTIHYYKIEEVKEINSTTKQ